MEKIPPNNGLDEVSSGPEQSPELKMLKVLMIDAFRRILSLVDAAHIERIHWDQGVAEGIIDEALSTEQYYAHLEKRYKVVSGVGLDEELKSTRQKINDTLRLAKTSDD